VQDREILLEGVGHFPVLHILPVFDFISHFYQLFTGEERRIHFFFDDFHFCRSRVIGLDSQPIFTLTPYRKSSKDHFYIPWFDLTGDGTNILHDQIEYCKNKT
jgi:hypothetical protein